jgi:hypothetical protein
VLILRDYIVSAASQIMASGGSNGDNPTNLGASDFSLVAATLDTNNAYKFMSGIEGEDRFNIPDLYKLTLIDLEILRDDKGEGLGHAERLNELAA